MRIGLSVAHTKKEPGKRIETGNGKGAVSVSEHVYSWFCSMMLVEELTRLGYKSFVTKGTLVPQVYDLNSEKCDVAVAMHFNGNKKRGWYPLVMHQPNDKRSMALASCIAWAWEGAVPSINENIKPATGDVVNGTVLAPAELPYYNRKYFCDNCSMPNIICEPFFAEDDKVKEIFKNGIDDPVAQEFMRSLAVAVAMGIDKYLKFGGNRFTATAPTEPQTLKGED